MEADLASIEGEDDREWPDERLKLIFTCCHLAIAPSAQVALSLRTLCGLTTAEIARASLWNPNPPPRKTGACAAQDRRGTHSVCGAGGRRRPERLATVLAVIYFVFSEGYAASSNAQLMRVDLCEEAIRLGGLLSELLPEEPEVLGLCALMAFHHARRATRRDSEGTLVPLEEQDRSHWDVAAISG